MRIEKLGNCDWCLRISAKVRLCQVRASVEDGWQQHVQWLCDKCRKNLHGQYKYIKPGLTQE